MDYERFLSDRLAELRSAKGVSARDMSLSIGQNVNYINQVENRKAMPSMQVFFYICEYLCVSPLEFFDAGNKQPQTLSALIKNLKKLDNNALAHISGVVVEMVGKK